MTNLELLRDLYAIKEWDRAREKRELQKIARAYSQDLIDQQRTMERLRRLDKEKEAMPWPTSGQYVKPKKELEAIETAVEFAKKLNETFDRFIEDEGYSDVAPLHEFKKTYSGLMFYLGYLKGLIGDSKC